MIPTVWTLNPEALTSTAKVRIAPTTRGPVKLTWFVVGSTDRDASARPRGLRRLPVMRPPVWRPPVEPSPAEQAVIRLVRRAKLFVWLRAHRHELFDEAFQAELAAAWADSPKGQPPVPPALLALATILQAYTGASDDGVIEATVMDRRWQLVLGCLDAERPPFSKGTLVGFRARLIGAGLDRRLVEQSVALAKAKGGFGDRALRAALDASPLWGAGRVEDTINLLGHALRKALGVIARQQGRGLPWTAGVAAVAVEAGVPQLGGPSVKAALDCDWDDPAARDGGAGGGAWLPGAGGGLRR